MRRILTALAAAADMCAGTMASADAITQFNKATRNGVFTLSQNQADYLGHPDARFIGFYHIREDNGTTFDVGITFNVTTMISSVTGNASNILTYLNGRNPSLSYKGG